jgi:FkbM family methyltransferase
MTKQNTTQSGAFRGVEKLIRMIPIIYFFFRSLVRFTSYFESDFFYLKKIFKKKKINIIDVGASDGISTLFFFRNLSPNKVYCYEPQKIFFKKLSTLKNKFKNIKVLDYGLAKKNMNMAIYLPYINFFGKKLYLSTYTFPKKKELMDQINLDFIIKPNIEKSLIKVKKFKLIKDKIHLIKIDTNGSEVGIVQTLIPLIKRDKPVLIIENNNIEIIYKHLLKYNYKKYCVINDKLIIHKKQDNANIIFKHSIII